MIQVNAEISCPCPSCPDTGRSLGSIKERLKIEQDHYTSVGVWLAELAANQIIELKAVQEDVR